MIAPLFFAALAAAPRVIVPGSTVRVLDVARKDAFWRFRDDLIGQLCVVGDPGLVRHHGRWYGGAMTCANDQPYYFYQVSVELGDYSKELAHILARVEPDPPEPADREPLDLADLFPIRERATLPELARWGVGTRVRIRAISASDATYGRKPSLIGLACTVADTGLTESGAEWYSGSLSCGDTGIFFFFQVAVEAPPDGAGPTSGTADRRLRDPSVVATRRVRIVEIAPTDLLAPRSESLVGAACTVADVPLLSTGDGWYAGRLRCGDEQLQFYQVGVAALNP